MNYKCSQSTNKHHKVPLDVLPWSEKKLHYELGESLCGFLDYLVIIRDFECLEGMCVPVWKVSCVDGDQDHRYQHQHDPPDRIAH